MLLFFQLSIVRLARRDACQSKNYQLSIINCQLEGHLHLCLQPVVVFR